MSGSFLDHTSTTQRRAVLRELGTRLRFYFRGMTDVLPARFIELLEQLRAEEISRQQIEDCRPRQATLTSSSGHASNLREADEGASVGLRPTDFRTHLIAVRCFTVRS